MPRFGIYEIFPFFIVICLLKLDYEIENFDFVYWFVDLHIGVWHYRIPDRD